MRTKCLGVLRLPSLLLAFLLLPRCSTPENSMSPRDGRSVLSPAKMVGFLTTREAARCREFYVGTLGFEERGEDQYALVLERDGQMVRIQKGATSEPRPFTVLGWNVADLDAAVARVEATGLRFEQFGLPGQDQHGIQTFPDGARVAWFKDPDGNVLSLAQLP